MRIVEIAGQRVAELGASGTVLASEADALDIVMEAYGQEYDLVVIPSARLSADFFKLSTGLAGAVMQKLTNYGLRAAFVGEIPAHLKKSKPLNDFIRETNKHKQIMVVPDFAALEALLQR